MKKLPQSELDTAINLMRERRYKEAAKILRKYPDDPTAKSWMDTMVQSMEYHGEQKQKAKGLPTKRKSTKGNWKVHVGITIVWFILNPFAGMSYLAFQQLFNRNWETDIRHIGIGLIFAFGAGSLINTMLPYALRALQ